MPLVPPPGLGPSATSATASIAADSNIETRPSQATKRLIPRSESARVGAVPAPREWRPTSSLLTVSSQVQGNTGTQVRIPSHTRNLLGRTWSIAHFATRTMSVPATCPSGGAIADSQGHSRATRHHSRWSADPQVTAMHCHRLPKADSPSSEPNPHRVGHSWEATRPSFEPTSVTAGHRPETNVSRGGL